VPSQDAVPLPVGGPSVDAVGGSGGVGMRQGGEQGFVVAEQKPRAEPVVTEGDVKIASYDSDATIDGKGGVGDASSSNRRMSISSGGAPPPVGTYSVNDMNEVVGSVGKASGSKKKKSKKGKGRKSAAGVFVEDID
jgi:hypothetical protein